MGLFIVMSGCIGEGNNICLIINFTVFLGVCYGIRKINLTLNLKSVLHESLESKAELQSDNWNDAEWESATEHPAKVDFYQRKRKRLPYTPLKEDDMIDEEDEFSHLLV